MDNKLTLTCVVYYLAYVVFGASSSYYRDVGHIPGMEMMFFGTIPAIIVSALVLKMGWHKRIQANTPAYRWLIVSGICTAFVIPTTPLMYTFHGVNVMVAMIIMRASLIVTGRLVDGILIYQGHSDKKVRWQENMAVLAAVGSVLEIIFAPTKKGEDAFNFLGSVPFMTVMALYIVPYGIRIYILSRFKVREDQKGMFGVEQLWAVISIVIAALLGLLLQNGFGWTPVPLVSFNHAMMHWQMGPILWSLPYGVVAFASVFIYIYPKGSATFNTTLNRAVSLVAGTTATLAAHWLFGLKAVKPNEWFGLIFIFVAIAFLAWASWANESEKKARFA